MNGIVFYGRIKSGNRETYAVAATIRKFVDIYTTEADGCLEIVNDNEKPSLDEGQKLLYRFAAGEDGRLHKTYFAVDARDRRGELPRVFSKLKIYGSIAKIGAWQTIRSWLESKDVDGINGWEAFQLAQDVSEDHPLFAPLAEEARQLLGLSAEQFDSILDECILD